MKNNLTLTGCSIVVDYDETCKEERRELFPPLRIYEKRSGNVGVTVVGADGVSLYISEEDEVCIDGVLFEGSFDELVDNLRNIICSITAVNFGAPTAGTGQVLNSTPSGAGATSPNALSVSVTNTGNADGTWNGVTIPPGLSVSITQQLDAATNQFKRIPSIAYDATGTTFFITQLIA